MPGSAQAQAGFETVVKVSDGDAAHNDNSQRDGVTQIFPHPGKVFQLFTNQMGVLAHSLMPSFLAIKAMLLTSP